VGQVVTVLDRSTRRTVLACGLVVIVLLGVAVTVIVTAPATKTTGSGAGAITVTEIDCAQGWVPPRSGQRQLTVDNAGTSVVDVALVGATSSLVYGEIEAMAPGTIRTMTVVVPPGRYRMQCTYSEGATFLSEAVTVSGPPVTDAHPYLPVTYS
jgi:hypothetical protein